MLTRLALPRILRWFPSSGLGTQLAKLQLRESGSWSFQDCVPKLELGNERITVPILGRLF